MDEEPYHFTLSLSLGGWKLLLVIRKRALQRERPAGRERAAGRETNRQRHRERPTERVQQGETSR